MANFYKQKNKVTMNEEFYTSKFSGEEIDSRLEKVDNIPKNLSELNNDVGYVDEEDMSNIEKEIKSLNDKVDNLEVGVGGGFKWIDV